MTKTTLLPTEEILEKCISIYTLFYNNRLILKQAPELHLSLEEVEKISTPEAYELFRSDLRKVSLFLLGIHSEQAVDIDRMFQGLKTYYKPEDFWYSVLLDYIKVVYEEEKLALDEKRFDLMEKTEDLLKELQGKEKKRQGIIDTITLAIKEKGFPVDGERLFKNYLTLYATNPNLAWKTLTSNPCYFAPLKTVGEKGNFLIRPREARRINKNLASFFKKFKINTELNN
ncbi:MAG: hypothetical protein EOM53_01245 [Alphaproteobacteria bacterium]|nr:hypothetical protein [Alphaproteobacteria bacterium]